MEEAIFIYNTIPTNIQCKKDELMKDICQKFLTKVDKKIDDFYFLYDGNKINLNLHLMNKLKKLIKVLER